MTQRLFLTFPAIFAAGLTVPVAAIDAPLSCPGDNAMANENFGVTIDTSGSGHSRVVVQTDPDGTVRLAQHGKDHAAVAVQQGAGGSLAIEQSGASAQANVVQGGACNAAALTQAGAGNSATINQSGNGNRVVVRQGPSAGDPK